MKRWIAAVCLLVGIGTWSPGVAQQPQAAIVRVPVQVVDAAGRPILDLQSKDFSVVEDNAAREIRTFAKGDSDGAYVIGYYPAQNPNTGFRRIQVKVLLPGVRVRADLVTFRLHSSRVSGVRAGRFTPPLSALRPGAKSV
jgi:hypothetical protein